MQSYQTVIISLPPLSVVFIVNGIAIPASQQALSGRKGLLFYAP